MLPELSRGTLNVIVARPVPPDSAFDTAGTSFEAARSAVKTIGVLDGPFESSSQAAAPQRASARANIAKRRIEILLE